jgi:hypothetical protein
MKHILDQHMKQLEKQEQKLLTPKEIPIIQNTITPVMDKIQDKIPEKLKSALDTAFYKGFQLIFDKGSRYIEKTYSKEKIELEYDINNYAIGKKLSNKYLKKLDKQSKQSKLLNTSFSVLEGGTLGLLGIGLPDIPLFLSLIVKTIYEVALSYGFSYDTPDERAYILLLICGAITKGDRQRNFDSELERIGEKIDHNISYPIDLEKQMRITADVISDTLLTSKFIQGIPVIGVVGGIVNFSILNRIGKYSGIKYKKRYLLKKMKEDE